MGRTLGLDLSKKDVCFVQWNQNCINQYRIGYQNKFDLVYYAPPHDAQTEELDSYQTSRDLSTSLLDYLANNYQSND